MKDNETVASYIATFRTYQYRVKDFGERALVHFFKKGLASRIKDEFVHYLGSLDTLDEIIDLSLRIDKRWQEHRRERKSTTQSHHPSVKDPSRTAKHFRPQQPQRNPPNHPRPSTSSSTFRPSSSNRPPPRAAVPAAIAKVLTSDGKLQESEKERRVREGLCTYCGGRHRLENCPKRPANSSKNV